MLKKIDRSALFLQENAPLFQCPLCHEPMTALAKGIICPNRHRFDLSKKGTLYFLDHQIKTEYDHEMFLHRGAMIQSGMYQPLLDVLAPLCENEQILDVGCGEGSFLNNLAKQVSLGASIGFDISKEGIYLATNQPANLFWCVADLTNLPFADASFSTILNIFSPSNYQEFDRILKTDGQVIKVVPRSGYLKELRAAFYPEDAQKQSYSNQQVVDKFQQIYPDMTQTQVTYVFDIPEKNRLSLLEMSPLEWGVSPERKAKIQANPLTQITIDLDILISKKN
ncbi:methyltransferase domain-containing protein [Enterococcus saccharolyticus]|uniref:Ribosomal RNA large subunit methyltransferase A n=1 Tax=Enterococcus saccharolyticus subsp. saccharolyticus ATCC 43076 TaxID=1139996 RepID=S0JM80_9ENTE|nr:methyltransferase domain-containing protein [Enterococcus saccharolyticus]EOT28096.1 ribosomal RNA large subunit methyltransferase A [Enterococcus saccharolyticus subsp. saccharolyticus ATCC 43076]EOT77474.1 ribosomal RNA large subunit methyltransferase A [Enterococcus saccharolyticus subsp. saccharolyticus ATCC 43076]OJG90753.1 ribosomal RNA large subunit methyltransferase A [Enterococcus saccharolyticus]